MTDRQVIHSVDADDYAWLKQLADADSVGVGEIVRRCIHFARQSQEDEPQVEVDHAAIEAQRREAERQVAIMRRRDELARMQAELAAMEAGETPEPVAADAPSVL